MGREEARRQRTGNTPGTRGFDAQSSYHVSMRWIVCLCGLAVFAQDPLPEDRGAAGLYLKLKKLQTTARVMHIVAHPDDEDAATVTYLSRGLGVEMTILSLTRGESGANLVTGDFFDRLGVLRTVEFQKAARYYDAHLLFTRAVDYGYSKNVAETFRQWDRREVLKDMVRAIRFARPHVILSRWQGTPRDGHGNHEAAGILSQEAFAAAADATQFPELNLPAWQASKLYSNNRNALDDWTVRVEHGVVDPLLGRSYSQFGREGYRMHRSQGAGAASARPGPSYSYYKLLASKVGDAAKEQSFFERLDVFDRNFAPVLQAFDIAKPAAVVPLLMKAQRNEKVDDALRMALGLQVEARVDARVAGPASPFRAAETFALAVPGQTFTATVKLHGGAATDIAIAGPRGTTVVSRGNGQFEITLPKDAPLSRVPWRRNSIRDTLYEVERAVHHPVVARVTHESGVVTETPLLVAVVDTLGVERLKPLAIAPPVSVKFATEAGILPLAASAYSLRCIVRSNVDGKATGVLKLALPEGWKSDPASLPFSFEKAQEEATLAFRVIAPAGRGAGEASIRAVAQYDGVGYEASFDEIGESLHVSAPARHTVRSIDVRVARGLHVGYVMGTGDDVPEGLRQLGVPVDLLDRDALASADLSKYSTILLGIRAYAVRNDVRTYNARLLDYVAKGGVLVVQYNTPEFDRNYGPYPYTMGRNPEEVSEEDSPVEMLDRNDPVFTAPNRITNDDFGGWVEQRGSKFLTTWDPRYKALLETHDTGQAPQKGGWLTAKHGKGLYVYCAYAWYRQLPYAVPGAARLFANLVSLGAAESAWRAQ